MEESETVTAEDIDTERVADAQASVQEALAEARHAEGPLETGVISDFEEEDGGSTLVFTVTSGDQTYEFSVPVTDRSAEDGKSDDARFMEDRLDGDVGEPLSFVGSSVQVARGERDVRVAMLSDVERWFMENRLIGVENGDFTNTPLGAGAYMALMFGAAGVAALVSLFVWIPLGIVLAILLAVPLSVVSAKLLEGDIRHFIGREAT